MTKLIMIIFYILAFTSCVAKSDHIIADLIILATSDLHAQMTNYDYYQQTPLPIPQGLSHLAPIIQDYRKNKTNVVLIDNGDTIQGTPIDLALQSDGITDKYAVSRVLEYLRYDAITLGNHEFNFGIKTLDHIIKNTTIPYISSNIYDTATNQPLVNPYIILKKSIKTNHGKKDIHIALIGATPEQVLLWDKKHLENRITTKNMVESIKEMVQEVRQKGADVVVVAAHSGINMPENGENMIIPISQIPGIDVLIAGHEHQVFPSQNGIKPSYPDNDIINNSTGKINNVAVIMPSSMGQYLGAFDIKLEYSDGKWVVQQVSSSLIAAGKSEDIQIQKMLQKEHTATIAKMQEKVATLDKPINNYFALVQNDASLQLINAAQTDYVHRIVVPQIDQSLQNYPILSAAAPFKNGGRSGPFAYTTIKAGDLSLGDIANLYIYPNTLIVLKVTGTELIEYLEWTSQIFNQINSDSTEAQDLISEKFPSFNFDVVSGIQYTIDATQASRYEEMKLINPQARRIKNITYDGRVVTANDVFLLAVNNYRASTNTIINKDNRNLVFDPAIENRAIIIDYAKTKVNLSMPLEKNWQLYTGMNNQVYFYSAKDAKTWLDNNDGQIKIEATESEKNGFGVYRISMKS
jgi:2',3'-cyclic-nucleotide 2'-phosphodiesterase/3'-nucleotidase